MATIFTGCKETKWPPFSLAVRGQSGDHYHWLFNIISILISLPGQTLRARLTGDEREREGGSADSEQDSVIQWNVYYVMTTLNLNCACDPCVTSYYRISTESHDCCNLIGSTNIPAEPTETCSESADLFLSLSRPL